MSTSQPAKIDLNKKSLPKQKTIQNFTIDAEGFRKTKNENPPKYMGNGSYQLTSAGKYATISHVGGVSFLVFLYPWASTLKF